MLNSIQIKNFRGFRDTTINSFKRINLITGQNNSGKTALLEALFLLLIDRRQSQEIPLPNLFRTSSNGNLAENFWFWLFHEKNLNAIIEIEGSSDDGQPNSVVTIKKNKERAGELIYSQFVWRGEPRNLEPNNVPFAFPLNFHTTNLYCNPTWAVVRFSTHPSDPVQDALNYNRVILKRRKKKVEELLQQVEPRLVSIEALQLQGGSPLIYAEINGLSEMIPVTQLGQGFCRLLNIYSEMLVSDAKVLLIDEVENGLHHSVLPIVWKGIFLAAREMEIQVFATTHSWECVQAADQVARKSDDYDFNLTRLDRVGDDIKSTTLDKENLETAEELHLEMR